MGSAATGIRRGATSAIRCIDIAGLFASAILRKNPTAEVLPFENRVVDVILNPRDSVMTNAQKLAAVGGGGTSCSAPLYELNRRKAKGDLVVYVSDNESWMDSNRSWNKGTETMKQWSEFKSRNPKAKLVCIDIQPYGHTQAYSRADILNVGGFSDQVFTVVAEFASDKGGSDHWVNAIDRTDI